jgi:hypothetical protein
MRLRWQINPADAQRLAMAKELLWWNKNGAVGTRPDKPSERAYAWIDEHYKVTEEIPPGSQISPEVPKIRQLYEGGVGVKEAIEIGGLLVKVKSNLAPRQWWAWLKVNVPFHQTTASHYMRCFERRDELKASNIDNLSDAYQLFKNWSRAVRPNLSQAMRRSWARRRGLREVTLEASAPVVTGVTRLIYVSNDEVTAKVELLRKLFFGEEEELIAALVKLGRDRIDAAKGGAA